MELSSIVEISEEGQRPHQRVVLNFVCVTILGYITDGIELLSGHYAGVLLARRALCSRSRRTNITHIPCFSSECENLYSSRTRQARLASRTCGAFDRFNSA
eukprot:6179245-Pleurochrysis_carterae.AAC.1